MENNKEIAEREEQSLSTQDMESSESRGTDLENSRPQYIGLRVTPENRNQLTRLHGVEAVNEAQKAYKSFLKGRKVYRWRGRLRHVITTADLGKKFEPQLNKKDE